jgi:hypothetical protein
MHAPARAEPVDAPVVHTSVRAEPVEAPVVHRQGFDKLSPNGCGGFDQLSPNGCGCFDKLSPNGDGGLEPHGGQPLTAP